MMYESWFGKVFGGGLGFMLGGPVGAVLGGAFGHHFDRVLSAWNPGYERWQAERRQRQEAALSVAAFAAMGRICKLSGRISRRHIAFARAAMAELGLGTEQQAAARACFRQGKNPDCGLDALLDSLRWESLGEPHWLLRFMDLQLRAAGCEGEPSLSQQALLESMRLRLGISRADFEGLQTNRGTWAGVAAGRGSLCDAYAILGLHRDATCAEVKRSYRRLLSRHHPDKLSAKGLTEAELRNATIRTRRIRSAYEAIRAAREC
jgi:DnaJ like chaperone protein